MRFSAFAPGVLFASVTGAAGAAGVWPDWYFFQPRKAAAAITMTRMALRMDDSVTASRPRLQCARAPGCGGSAKAGTRTREERRHLRYPDGWLNVEQRA